ncbi:outer membrane lipoprotein-sorting protein [Candidatus Bipolaricaulota bacterium]|nr:outer membrane lipoprotein-sorting protein [Candidatus Bipolaricaulota bacterium]
MRKFIVGCVVAAWAAGLGALGQGDDLLAALDRARFLDTPASQLTVVVRSEVDGEVDEAEVRLAFKEIAGGDHVRIEFVRPEDQAGQVFLVTPQGTYFWQPELFAPLRTSGTQAAFGDAAVAQLSGIRFAEEYRIAAEREALATDGTPILELELRATSPGVPFQALVVTVDPAGRPRELRLLAVTGVLLYRVTLVAYAELDGDVYVREQVVENALVEGSRTVLTIVDVSFETLPDEVFDPAGLGDG